jgi:pimeloyl-ACP methyl ester carboxylesterase
MASKINWRRNVVRMLIIAFGLYLIPCLLLTIFQRDLLYHPPLVNPAAYQRMGLQTGMERWQNAGGQNIGWKKLSSVQPPRGQVMITYGNGGSGVGCYHYVQTMQRTGMDVYVLEYPDYADRPGSPSQTSFFQAAEEGFSLLPTNVPTYLVGESLGTGVAAYLAGTHPDRIRGVVLLAPYAKLVDVAQAHFPWFPVRLLLFDRFDSAWYLKNYEGPVVIMTGTADRVVPERFGLCLFVGYDGSKKLWEFPGAGHGDVFGHFDEKWPEIKTFWDLSLPAAAGPMAK